MSTALVRLSSPEDTAALVASGHLKPNALGEALLRLPAKDAKMHMQTLPALVQVQTATAAIGSGTEVPLLPLMLADQAAITAMIDTSMFEVPQLITLLRRAGDEDGLGDFDEVVTERKRRMITLTNRKGESVRVPVYVNPDRAWAYFQTVIRAEDRAWRREVLRKLGAIFLAYLLACKREDKLEVEDEEWEAVMNLCPETYLARAREAAGEDIESDGLEDDLIKRHRAAMKEAFTLPEDTLAAEATAPTKAADLAADLDMG